VSQRAVREIGIRKALGATTAGVLRQFVHKSIKLCLPAVIAGALAGGGLLRVIASEIGPTTGSALWSIPLVAGGFFALV
jgi:ABC-type antimicrobial peptide transport system permease subunit